MSEVNKEEKLPKEDQEVLESLLKEKPAIDAFKKINAEPIKISVYRQSSLVEAIEIELGEIDQALKDSPAEERKNKLIERKEKLTKRLEEEDKNKVEGWLHPLTYRDINDIKAAITEAVIHFNDYNFDPEVKMSRVLMEERYMTVFCSLKKAKDKSPRYFKSLDEIALLDEDTINAIHRKWENHFVLSEDELKN